MSNGKHPGSTAFGLLLLTLCVTMLASCPNPLEDIPITSNYAVKFDTHGGSEILPKYFVSGSEVYPQSFTSDKNGYFFSGWFDAESGGTRFGGDRGTETITINRNLLFHAQWLINRTIRFDVRGGEPLPDLNVPDGGFFDPALYHTMYPGHGFLGWWSTPDTSGIQRRSAFAVTGNLTLYAHWDASGHTAAFKIYGGSPVHAMSIPHGDLLDLESYVSAWPDGSMSFAGWYNAPEGGVKYPDTVTVNNDITFHAQWKTGEHTVSFNTGEGSAVPAIRLAHNGTLYPSAYVSTLADHGFAGWWDAGGTNQYQEPIPITGDITLYAKWVQGYRTVRFVSNGGSAIHAVALQAGESLDLGPYVPVKPQYGFAGWHTDAACSNKVTSVSAAAADITLYAKWETGAHTVNFNTPGGSTVPSLLAAHGESLDPANYVSFKEGFGFVGWFKQDKTTEYTAAITVNTDLTLYAVWDYGYHTVGFVTGSGAAPVHAIRTTHGDTIDPSVYTSSKSGYGFAGWWDAESGGTKYTAPFTVNSDMTLYAHWDQSKWTVSFNTHGGSEVASVQVSQTHNELNVDAITASRTGYRLAGWFSAETGGTQYSGTAFDVTGNMTMHARWEKLRLAVVPDGTSAYTGNAVVTYKDNSTVNVTVDAAGCVKIQSGQSWPAPGEVIKSFKPEGGVEFLIGRRDDLGTIYMKINADKSLKLRDAVNGIIPIGSYSEFQLINSNPGGSFRQEADLDLLGDMSPSQQWTPVGASFTGTFDGANYNIDHIYINTTVSGNYGLFNRLGGNGTLKNINLHSGSINALGNVGGILGQGNSGLIINCTNGANLTSDTGDVGGIAGMMSGEEINGCSNSGTITTTGGRAGGMCGSSSAIITNCTNSGRIIGGTNSFDCGGIIGTQIGGFFSGCSNSGNVTGVRYAGGIVAHTQGPTNIQKCFNSGNVNALPSATSSYIGGIAGHFGEAEVQVISIYACYNTGTVGPGPSNAYIGGVIGYIYASNVQTVMTIAACYNTGSINSSGSYAGGVLGGASGSASINACYSTGTKTGSSLWGIVGSITSATTVTVNITACYWSGNADGGIGTNGSAAGTRDVQQFANGVWPSAGTGTGKSTQWGTGNGSGNGKWWKSIGSWNSGSPVYPKLAFEP